MQLNILKSACYVVLLILVAISVTNNVRAQSPSTSILELNSPSQVLLGEDMTVTVTVKYDRGSDTSDVLSVMIIEVYTDIPRSFTAHASSSPDTCSTTTFARFVPNDCIISPGSNSGTESVTFQFSLNQVMVWQFMITSAIQMASSPYNVESDSLANQTFAVTVKGNETVNISNLQYPTTASTSILAVNSPSEVMLGQGLIVTATVKYDRGNYTSDFLIVTMFDVDAVTFETGEVTGYATSSPDACLYPNNISLCIINPTSNSGTESVTWHLSLAQARTTHLVIATSISHPMPVKMESGSRSWQKFTVTVTEPSLPVLPPIPITIDGIFPQALNLGYFYLVTNGTHTISAPQTVNVTAGERLRFDHWSDGSTNATETVNLQVATPYSVAYVKQYKLTLVTRQGNSTGDGWYDENTTAKFSVPSSVPMNGSLGTLGGKYDFQGWYENNTLLSSSINSSLKMNGQHTLTASWTQNYTAPITILGVAVIAVVGLAYYLIRKKNGQS